MEATEPMSDDQAVDALLMPMHDDNQTDEETETEEVTDEDQPDADEVEAEDDAEAEQADEADDDEDADQEAPQTHIVKIDGEDVEVTLEDLKRSYSGNGYIQKGMAENAKLRKQTEAFYQQLEQERAELQQLTQTLRQGGLARPPQAPDPELAQKDPIAYNEALGRFFHEQQAYQAQQAQLQQVQSRQEAARSQAQQAMLAEQRKLLHAAIPELAHPETGGDVQKRIVKTAESYGYSADELQGISDHRAVQVLNDARKWHELQRSKEKATEKASKARPVVKPGAKKAANAGEKAKREAQRKLLARTGSDEAALALMFKET